MRIRVQALMLSAAALALTACGGGGGGGGGPGGGVVTPPVPPKPTPLVLLAPIAAIAGVNTGSSGGAATSSVSITDPDAPSATTYGGLTIDGDETLRVQFSAGGVTADQTYDAATYKGESTTTLAVYTGVPGGPAAMGVSSRAVSGAPARPFSRCSGSRRGNTSWERPC